MRKTVFIGLGGLGQRVVARIKKQAGELKVSEDGLGFIAIDSDLHDLTNVAEMAQIPTIPLYAQQDVRSLVNLYHGLGVEAWFPTSPKLLQSEGYSTAVRAVGRLGFIHAMETDRLQKLRDQLSALFGDHWPEENELQIVVAASLSGGIGSGSFIQLALWLRKTVWELLHLHCDICGVFAGPEVFIRSYGLGISASEQLRANACAALRELEAFTKSAETGELVPGYDAFTLDGLQLARTGPGPIYDRISIYEGGEAVSFEMHLDRMAQGALLCCAAGGADARFLAVGSALARYPKKEVVEYCSLRGAIELLLKNWQVAEELTQAQVEEKTDRLLAQLQEMIDGFLQERETVLTQMHPVPESVSGDEMEELLHRLLNETDGRLRYYHEALAGMEQWLCARIVERHSAEGDYRSAPLFRAEDRDGLVSPALLKAVVEQLEQRLQTLRAKAKEQLFTNPQPQDWMRVFEEEPLPNGFRSVAAVAGEAYPLTVWKQLNPVMKTLLGKSTRERFLQWVLHCRQAGIEKNKQLARAKLVEGLFGMLISELESLQSTMALFYGRIGMCLDRLLEKHNLQEVTSGDHLIGSFEGIKQRICEDLPPYDDEKQIAESYLRNLLALHTEQKWQELGGDDRHLEHRIAETCKEFLQYIRSHVLSGGHDLIDMEATEALQYCGAPENGLRRLCAMLYRKAVAGAMAASGESTADLERTVIFGVSGDCEMKADMDAIVKSLPFAQLLDAHGMDRAALWCLCMDRGSAPADRVMEQCAEAYNWLCRRAKNPGEGQFEPHMDKRWSGQLFGLE